MDADRRRFVRNAGLGLLAFEVAGAELLLTPREARARSLPLRTLTATEATTLEALGEILLPGAREAGIAYFVDQHLSVDAADSLLLIRYLDVPPPYVDAYRAGLAALDSASHSAHDRPFTGLSTTEAEALVRVMGARNPEGWHGLPAPLFYFFTRSDAVDVVYGTEEGFARLGIPYMAHIRPPRKW